MKAIVLLLSVILVAQTAFAPLITGCSEQYVPDLNSICIRPNFIQGCEKYKNVDQCAQCSTDLDLQNGQCLNLNGAPLTSNGFIGCLADNGISCSNCANGYIRVDGVCLKGVKFCSDYDSENKCIRCESEYSLIFGECKHNLMLGCKLEQADHTCLECFKPFQLKNYQCVIPNCKSYNDYGCYSCECGYFISQAKSCQVMQNGCLKYYRGTCVQCVSHYKLKGGACSIEGCVQLSEETCKTCKDGYDLIDGSCKFQNCAEWKDDSCLICDEGFNLEGKKCVKNVSKYICSG